MEDKSAVWSSVDLSARGQRASFHSNQVNCDHMSSVQLTSPTEEKMSMYENMVEDLVNSDESSRYMLDGKTRH